MNELAIGDVAPDFTLQTMGGREVRLSELRGKKVLVSFLRNAQCAICNLWVATTGGLAPGWRADGLEVLAVFESSVDRLRVQFEGRTPTFEVLADPHGVVHDSFGSRSDQKRVEAVVASGVADRALARAEAAGFAPRKEDGANFFRLPAEVLIDKNGIVAAIHVAESVSDHFDSALVTRFARDESLRRPQENGSDRERYVSTPMFVTTRRRDGRRSF